MTPIESTLALIERVQRDVLPARFDSRAARVMLLTIGLQESRFQHRIQLVGSPPRPTGPARGFWQFEERGGVAGVMSHPASARYAHAATIITGHPWDRRRIWEAFGLPAGDMLAAVFARLLLWTDPRPLPAIGDSKAAWDCYIRNWRPGRPHPASWPPLYQQALGAV